MANAFATEEEAAASKRLAFRSTFGASSKGFPIYLLLTSAIQLIELLLYRKKGTSLPTVSCVVTVSVKTNGTAFSSDISVLVPLIG